MEQRNEPKTAELIKNARYCCGDIKCEGEKDCGDYCLDGRDERNGDLRWCRQWLVHDLADRLEQLERDLETFKAFHERYAQQTSKKYVEDVCALTARAEKAEEETKRTVREIETYYDCADICNVCLCGNESKCKCVTPFFGCGFTYDRRGLRGQPQEGEKE